MSLSGQVALVTGGARGIGATVAAALAEAGAAVVVGDVDEAGAIDTAAGVAKEHGTQVLGIGMDITARTSVDAAIATTEAEVGPLSILVNNAGIDVIKPFIDTTPDEWERIIAVNLMGLFHCCQAALEVMQPRGGAIVNFASDAGRVGSSREAVYSATKGGVIAFTKTLAREVARYGIRVNCVSPGPPTPRCSRRSRRPAPICATRWHAPSRCGASANPPTSRRRSCSSPATVPATSPGRRSP